MKPIIAITTGDPFGVGPEVCLKAAASPDVLEVCRPLLIGDRSHLLDVARRLPAGVGGNPAAWPEVARSGFATWGTKQGDDFSVAAWDAGPAFYDLADLGPAPASPGPSAEGGRASVKYVKQAVALVRVHAAEAIVTAPLSKTAMRLAGHEAPGHTELLADLCGVERRDAAMLFVSAEIKVALLSIHLGLREAIAAITPEAIGGRLDLVRSEHLRWFGEDPRIGVCALNPHAGEGGMFGREEIEILEPSVAAAARSGMRVEGPFPADTLFGRAAKGEFDVVLALFHDQATIAVKSRSFGGAVNMTLGLPLLRTSVDHGTAYDLAGRGVAGHGSLVEAIRLAARLAPRARAGS
jgi:4-hydroxythreonine-4-phosphate dehydrogenase